MRSVKLSAAVGEDGSPGSPALPSPLAPSELGTQKGMTVAFGKTPFAASQPGIRTPKGGVSESEGREEG